MRRKIINFITVLGLAVLVGVLLEIIRIVFSFQIHSVLQGALVGFLCVLFYNQLEKSSN